MPIGRISLSRFLSTSPTRRPFHLPRTGTSPTSSNPWRLFPPSLPSPPSPARRQPRRTTSTPTRHRRSSSTPTLPRMGFTRPPVPLPTRASNRVTRLARRQATALLSTTALPSQPPPLRRTLTSLPLPPHQSSSPTVNNHSSTSPSTPTLPTSRNRTSSRAFSTSSRRRLTFRRIRA